jgi:hypothetical protein
MKRLHALNGYQEATLGTHYIHNEYFLAVWNGERKEMVELL